MKTPCIVVLLVATALAGCSDAGGAAEPDVIVVSGNIVDATEAPKAPRDPGKGKGHIAGFVVDETVRPVEGATVSLPALDLKDITDRDGRFEFVDLAPGDHIIRITAEGHQEAESLIEVKKGQFTRTKVILHSVPPPEPYRELAKFDGFADVTTTGLFPYLGFLHCFQCSWSFSSGANASAVVLEATMAPHTGPAGGANGFETYVYGAAAHDIQPNPLWLRLDERLEDISRIEVTPYSDPAPETNKEFEVFVTTFYNEAVPAGYSVVEGRA